MTKRYTAFYSLKSLLMELTGKLCVGTTTGGGTLFRVSTQPARECTRCYVLGLELADDVTKLK